MNKKFSTLMMAGMLVAAPSFVGAQVTLNGMPLKDAADLAKGTADASLQSCLVVRDVNNNGKVDQNDVILTADVDYTGKITYKGIKVTSNDQKFFASEEELSKYMWDLTEKKEGTTGSALGWSYGLMSHKTGVYLTVKNGNIVDKKADSFGSINATSDAGKTTYTSSAFTSVAYALDTKLTQKSGLFTYKGVREVAEGETKPGTRLLVKQDGSVAIVNLSNITGADANQCGFIYVKLGERDVNLADELNDIQGGEGFQFSFDKSNEVKNNIFEGQNLRAFRVVAPIEWGLDLNGFGRFSIPAGIYLASEWDGLSENTLKFNTITTKEEFQKLTLVAATPQSYVEVTNSDRAKGHGFMLELVKASEMNFYKFKESTETPHFDAEELSEKAEVFVGNACFKLTANVGNNGNDQYKLSLENARLATDKNNTDAHKNVGVVIGTTLNINNNVNDVEAKNNYLMTNGENQVAFNAVPSSSQYDAKALLNEGTTPAIYTLEFVGGKAEGQFLTMQREGYSFGAATMPALFVNENDPMFQFVVSDIKDAVKNPGKDKIYETIVLTNRLTKKDISFELYTTAEENTFIIFPVSDYSIAVAKNANGQLYNWSWDNIFNVKGMKVKFNEQKDVDKFATFESRESYNGLVSFQFANTAESSDRLYAAAERYKTGANKGEIINGSDIITSEELTEQFELIRSEAYNYITNDFKYIDANGNLRNASGANVQDTVAFYTYKVKLFDADEEGWYLTNQGLKSWSEYYAHNFIIKENYDGSVALFENDWFKDLTTPVFDQNWFWKDKNVNPHATYYNVNTTNWNKDEYTIGVQAWEERVCFFDLTNVANQKVKTFMVDEPVYGTLNPVNQTTTFENAKTGTFLNVKSMNGINAAIAASESMAFDLIPADVETNVPSFFITNGGNFMYFAKDSAETGRLTDWEKYTFEDLEGDDFYHVIFKAAELSEDGETLVTTVNGQAKTVAMKADATKGILGGLKNFKFNVIESGEGDDTYVIRSNNASHGAYLASVNGIMTVTAKRAGATRFIIETEEHSTANEDVTVSEVTVIAGEGQLTIAGAAGKKVVVSNILGQVVVNTVLSSDNATIAAPQGVVVVAVEGEAAVKAIVK